MRPREEVGSGRNQTKRRSKFRNKLRPKIWIRLRKELVREDIRPRQGVNLGRN